MVCLRLFISSRLRYQKSPRISKGQLILLWNFDCCIRFNRNGLWWRKIFLYRSIVPKIIIILSLIITIPSPAIISAVISQSLILEPLISVIGISLIITLTRIIILSLTLLIIKIIELLATRVSLTLIKLSVGIVIILKLLIIISLSVLLRIILLV